MYDQSLSSKSSLLGSVLVAASWRVWAIARRKLVATFLVTATLRGGASRRLKLLELRIHSCGCIQSKITIFIAEKLHR